MRGLVAERSRLGRDDVGGHQNRRGVGRGRRLFYISHVNYLYIYFISYGGGTR